MVRIGIFALFFSAPLFGGKLCLLHLTEMDHNRVEFLLGSHHASDFEKLNWVSTLFHDPKIIENFVTELNKPRRGRNLDDIIDTVLGEECKDRTTLKDFLSYFPELPRLEFGDDVALRNWIKRNLDSNLLSSEERKGWIKFRTLGSLNDVSTVGHAHDLKKALEGKRLSSDKLHLIPDMVSRISKRILEMREEIAEKKNLKLNDVDGHAILEHRGCLKVPEFGLLHLIVFRLLDQNVPRPITFENFLEAWKRYFWHYVHTWTLEEEFAKEEAEVKWADAFRHVHVSERLDSSHETKATNPAPRQKHFTEKELQAFLRNFGAVAHPLRK